MRIDISNLMIIVFIAGIGCKAPDTYSRALELASKQPNKLPRSWLKCVVSVEQEEKKLFSDCSEQSPASSKDPCKRWEELKNEIHPGDDVWYWESEQDNQGGFAIGYCLLRDQSIIYVAHVAYAERKMHK